MLSSQEEAGVHELQQACSMTHLEDGVVSKLEFQAFHHPHGCTQLLILYAHVLNWVQQWNAIGVSLQSGLHGHVTSIMPSIMMVLCHEMTGVPLQIAYVATAMCCVTFACWRTVRSRAMLRYKCYDYQTCQTLRELTASSTGMMRQEVAILSLQSAAGVGAP